MAVKNGNLTLEYFNGTYAGDYVYNNFLRSSAIEKLTGDVDCNGIVDINDVTYIQLYRVGLYELDNKKLELSDVNSDIKVTLRDATTIQMYLLNMLTEL